MSLQTNRCATEHGQPDKDDFAFAVKGTPSARQAALPVFITSATLGGCALCALIGIFGAIAARGIFVAAGLDSVLPVQLFVCSVGLVVAALTWLIWFGQ